jgi:hypothetical protein
VQHDREAVVARVGWQALRRWGAVFMVFFPKIYVRCALAARFV